MKRGRRLGRETKHMGLVKWNLRLTSRTWRSCVNSILFVLCVGGGQMDPSRTVETEVESDLLLHLIFEPRV